LKGDINEKLKALKAISLNQITAFGKDKSNENSIKSIAFQLGQTILLYEGKEVYTKNQILICIPELKKYLLREPNVDLEDLQKCLSEFVELLKIRVVTMKNFSEYKYEDANNF
jgi:hypothetical protein